MVHFGPFEVNPRTGELWKSGVKIRLQDQPFKVLSVLLERPGELVTREELRSRVWPSEAFGDFDHAVNIAIAKLRTALGDSADDPHYIETLPRRGYRLMVPVENGDAGIPPLPEIDSLPEPPLIPSTEPLPSMPERIPPPERGLRKSLFVRVGLILGALAVALGIYEWTTSRRSALSFENMRLSKLTENGKAVEVAISPDGRYAVYVLAEGGNRSLWVRQVATGSDVQILPSDLALFQGLTFSSDGNYIYFVRSDSDSFSYSSLYQMPVLGGTPRRLLQDIDTPISISPDNKRIAFVRGNPVKGESYLVTASIEGGDERVLLIEKNPEMFTFVRRYFGPAWSPDGRTIVASAKRMVQGEMRCVVLAVSADDGKARELYSTKKLIGQIQWLPEGTGMLLVIADPPSGLRGQLWHLTYPSGKIRRLTNDLTNYDPCCLDMTRDGSAIVTVQNDMVSDAWIAPEGISDQARQLTSGEGVMSASWFRNDKIVIQNSKNDLELVNLNGGPPLVLTSDQHDNFLPSGCADGKHIVFVSERNGSPNIWRMDGDGTHVTQLTSTAGSTAAECSPDGKWILYTSQMDIFAPWKISIQGGTPVQLLKQSCNATRISPDGKLIACGTTFLDPHRNLAVIVDAATGQTLRSVELPRDAFDFSWAPDGLALDVMLTRNGVSNISRYPLSGAPAKQLTHFTKDGIIHHFSWSPDGKQLLIPRGYFTRDVVLISNFR